MAGDEDWELEQPKTAPAQDSDWETEHVPSKVEQQMNAMDGVRQSRSFNPNPVSGWDIIPAVSMVRHVLPALAQAAQREEAAVAEPILNAVRSNKGPALGREKEDLDLAGSFVKGAKGETFSRYKEGEQAQLGDLGREAGLPEPISAGLGLAASSLLPSNMIIGEAAKGEQAAAKALPPVANDFVNTFRKIAQEAGGNMHKAAEVFHQLSGIPSELVMYAFKKPEILGSKTSNPAFLGDLANEVTARVKRAAAANPNAFGPSDQIPLDIANEMTNEFKTHINEKGKALAEQVKAVKEDSGYRIPKADVERKFKDLMDQRGLLNDKGEVKAIFKDEPEAQAFDELRGHLDTNLGSQRSGLLNIQDVIDLKRKLGDVAYKHGAPDALGINRPHPSIQAMADAAYGHINALTQRHYADYPELLSKYAEYSKLAEVRGDVARNLGDPNKLAKFIRGVADKDPEQMSKYSELLNSLPNAQKHAANIDQFTKLRSTSLRSAFPFLDEMDPTKMSEGFEKLLHKPFDSLTQREKLNIERLQGVIKFPMIENYLDHHVAKAFSGKSNLLSYLAYGGVASELAHLPQHPLITLATGGMLTDPRGQAGVIRRFAPVVKDVGPHVGRAISGTVNAVKRAAPAVIHKAVAATQPPTQEARDYAKEFLGV